MSTLVFTALKVYKHEEYGRPSTELEAIMTEGKGNIASETPDRNASLTFRVKPEPDTRLDFTTGESIRDLEGFITVKPGDSDRPIASADKAKNQIGLIQYFGGHTDDTISVKARYSVTVLVPPSQFNELALSLDHGRIPPSIWVDVEGLELPTEFSYKWDNKTVEYLPVVSIRFELPLAVFEPMNSEDEDVAGAMPATRNDLAKMTEALSVVVRSVEAINAKLGWILGISVLLLFIALTRKYW